MTARPDMTWAAFIQNGYKRLEYGPNNSFQWYFGRRHLRFYENDKNVFSAYRRAMGGLELRDLVAEALEEKG
jgi:hypothetical protein